MLFPYDNFQDVKKGLEKKWKRDNEHLPTYDFILQHGLENYIKYCTKFAWLMVSQVPPLEIEYKDNIFNPRTHVLSQLFSFDGDQSRTRRILCYLWPTLQDCQGKVLVKGEVILG